MTIWNSTCNPCFSTFDQFFFVFHGLKTGFFLLFIEAILFGMGGDIRFCGQKQTLIKVKSYLLVEPNFYVIILMA